ncbi:histone H1.9-like [Dipodomys merriami]|uniref:histone H1.9-like n=1 Tax=Dipodomys merriami TaxID=94247 RepID=UPI0038556DFD
MQKDTSPVAPPAPSATNTAMGGNWQASASGTPSKSETGPHTFPKANQRPSMSKVILRAVADKGLHNRVSLAALKKAVAGTGYNMTRNSWRFKCVIQKLLDSGMIKQVSGRGYSGSFSLGKKQAKNIRAKRPQQQRKSGQRRSGHRRSGQHRSRVGSKQGQKQLFKGVRRATKGRRT